MNALAEITGDGSAFGGETVGDAAVQNDFLMHAQRSLIDPFSEQMIGVPGDLRGAGGGRGDARDLRFDARDATTDFGGIQFSGEENQARESTGRNMFAVANRFSLSVNPVSLTQDCRI